MLAVIHALVKRRRSLNLTEAVASQVVGTEPLSPLRQSVWPMTRLITANRPCTVDGGVENISRSTLSGTWAFVLVVSSSQALSTDVDFKSWR